MLTPWQIIFWIKKVKADKRYIRLKQAIILTCSAILLSGCFIHRTELMKGWPDSRVKSDYNEAPVRNATVFLNNGNPLKGEIKFVIYLASNSLETIEILFLPSGKKRKNDIRRLKADSINYIRVYPDSLSDTIHHVDYYHMVQQSRNLYVWYLAQRQNIGIAIRDMDFKADTLSLQYFFILLITPPKIIEEVNYTFGFMTSKNLQNELLKIINKRYLQHFKQEDFKDAHVMADYILEMESKK